MEMFNPPHPGGLIAEYLEDYGVSLRSLARDLDVSPATLSKIQSGKASITPEVAVKLEAGLGLSAKLWLSMQASYDISQAREKVDISHIVASPHKHTEHAH